MQRERELDAEMGKAEKSSIDISLLEGKGARDFLEGQGFFHKFGQKVIDLVAQSINRLCWAS